MSIGAFTSLHGGASTRELLMAVDIEKNLAAADWAPLTVTPDARGRFGQFGGKYAPETLMPALDELEAAYADARRDPPARACAGSS